MQEVHGAPGGETSERSWKWRRDWSTLLSREAEGAGTVPPEEGSGEFTDVFRYLKGEVQRGRSQVSFRGAQG